MATLATFAVSFVVGFTGAATPGPMLLVVMAESARAGAVAAVLIAGGHAILELAATIGLSAGLTTAAEEPAVAITASILGGGFLAYVAVQALRDAWRGVSLGSAARPGRRLRGPGVKGVVRLLGIGILVSLGNPYWTVWWLSVASGLIQEAAKIPVTGLPAFYVGHILSDLAWYCAVGLAAAAGGRLLGGGLYRGILAGCGLFLTGFSAYLFLKAASLIAGR